jgi:hypothetical protein
MIGVIADSADHEIVREFFELFKTPWEFYQRDRHYDVLLSDGKDEFDLAAMVTVIYSGRNTWFDSRNQARIVQHGNLANVCSYRGARFPLYGETITLEERGTCLLRDEESKACAAFLDSSKDQMVARIGFDLFNEIRMLLTVGQPPENAHVPTLEVHIAFLRDLIRTCGMTLVEIPPVPEGFQFVACLTHDVDHPSIRQHRLDHTVVGFLLRAIFGSLVDTLLGRMSIRCAVRNWAAAMMLPFVYLGFANDFWADFGDRYLELEKELPSTFFVIPRKNYAGRSVDGDAPALRAARYEAKELNTTICELRRAGREVGLHGIDAWLDSSSGYQELEEVRGLTGATETGVRMHWLYYNEKSPAVLEKAGAAYDSTIGYNETVGYRSGTTQVYKPLGVEQLLELPMHAMDTALFYLSYLGLSPRKASERLRELTDNAVQHGGCLTINWHDRSLAPERLWGESYRNLLWEMKSQGAWFCTAGQAVAWFRKRRSVVFETDSNEPGGVRARIVPRCGDNSLPGLRVRIHKARESNGDSCLSF